MRSSDVRRRSARRSHDRLLPSRIHKASTKHVKKTAITIGRGTPWCSGSNAAYQIAAPQSTSAVRSSQQQQPDYCSPHDRVLLCTCQLLLYDRKRIQISKSNPAEGRAACARKRGDRRANVPKGRHRVAAACRDLMSTDVASACLSTPLLAFGHAGPDSIPLRFQSQLRDPLL